MNGAVLVESFDRIIAKAWADDDFKAALQADPRGALEAHGIEVPEGLTLKVLENTGNGVPPGAARGPGPGPDRGDPGRVRERPAAAAAVPAAAAAVAAAAAAPAARW